MHMFIHVAENHLNGAMLYVKKMHVTFSKHAQVQIPQPGSNMTNKVFEGGTCVYKIIKNLCH